MSLRIFLHLAPLLRKAAALEKNQHCCSAIHFEQEVLVQDLFKYTCFITYLMKNFKIYLRNTQENEERQPQLLEGQEQHKMFSDLLSFETSYCCL